MTGALPPWFNILPAGHSSLRRQLKPFARRQKSGQSWSIQFSAAPEPPEASLVTGDELFVIGSILFSIAAFVSALTASGESGSDALSILRRRTSVAVASLFELSGVAFIVGTLGFYPAGPLGMATCPEGTTKLETGGALLFVAGSIAYTLGSMMILAFEVWNTYKYERETGKPTSPAEWAADSSTFLSTLENRGEEENDDFKLSTRLWREASGQDIA